LPEHRNPHANDTVTIIGFWPLSILEQMVLASERYFYELKQKPCPRFEFIGSDIKIMALRREQKAELTLCVPFHADKISNQKGYFECKMLIESGLQKFLEKNLAIRSILLSKLIPKIKKSKVKMIRGMAAISPSLVPPLIMAKKELVEEEIGAED